eukprot:8869419-Pyramimonas_sp.AAC.1
MRGVARGARRSATGVDGLPYDAWGCNEYGIRVLFDALDWVMSGQRLFLESNTTIQALLPKAITEHEMREGTCTRAPDKIRVLGLRNTDVKIMPAVMNRALRPVVAHVAPQAQR